MTANVLPTPISRRMRPGRLRELFDLVKDREDWRRPIDKTLDEPAVITFMSEARRCAARQAFARDLNEAIAHYTGERGVVLSRAGKDRTRFRVRARGYNAVRRSRALKVGFLGRIFG